MRITHLCLAAAALFATASFASAQSPTPSPAPSAAPTKAHRQKKATPAPTATPAGTVAAATPAASPAAPAAASPTPAKKTRAKKNAAASGTPSEVLNATPAPGGGPGMVWVNTKSKVYHKQGSRYYGKTKQGKYMSEQDATAEGDKAAGHDE